MIFKLKRSGPNKRYRFKGYITVREADKKRRFERQKQAVYQYAFLIIAVIAVVVAVLAAKPWEKVRDILTLFGFM